MPLQASGGGLQVPHEQLAEQVRLPVVPQKVAQGPVPPAAQGKPSSVSPSQSSSRPLQISAGA
jgi:hypothetical protein